MAAIPTCVRAFYSPELYCELRTQRTGWGIEYSLTLLAVQLAAAALSVYQMLDGQMLLSELKSEGLALVVGGAILFRAVMLASLTLAARLMAAAMRLPLTNAAAARVTAVAYTPVVLFDTIGFFAVGQLALPPILFGGGIVMLLAALWASK